MKSQIIFGLISIFSMEISDHSVVMAPLTRTKFVKELPSTTNELFSYFKRIRADDSVGYDELKWAVSGAITTCKFPTKGMLSHHLKNMYFLIELFEVITELPQDKDVRSTIVKIIDQSPHVQQIMHEAMRLQDVDPDFFYVSKGKFVKKIGIPESLVQLDYSVVREIRNFIEDIKPHLQNEALSNHFGNGLFMIYMYQNMLDNQGELNTPYKEQVAELVPIIIEDLYNESADIKRYVAKILNPAHQNNEAHKGRTKNRKSKLESELNENMAHKIFKHEDPATEENGLIYGIEHLPPEISTKIKTFLEDILPLMPERNLITTHFRNMLAIFRVYDKIAKFKTENAPGMMIVVTLPPEIVKELEQLFYDLNRETDAINKIQIKDDIAERKNTTKMKGGTTERKDTTTKKPRKT